MKTVIETQEEYAQTQVFLADTAISYGQDILTLTERYIKFRAATQQANMSVFDTQRIFDSAAKAAAVLGLKTDEVNGVFLALEQMISKGKVTTEELRRQLGERLPGAFGIMADAIGVSLRELDRMLKAGEVLSAETLPKFADALQAAYGIEAVETVDTLAAALGRLKTSWVQFVDSLEASDVYKFIINELAQTLMQLDLVLNYFSLVYTRTSKLSQEQVSRSFDFLLKLNSRKAREFQDVIKTYSNQSLEEIKNNSHRIIEEINSVYRISFKQAGLLYDAFVRKVEQKIADRKGGFAEAFDLETYKKELNRVKEDTESLVNVENSELADAIVKSNKYLTDRSTTYKDVLRQQDKELEIQRKLAEINTSNYEDLKTRRDLTTQENKEYEYWTNRAIALTEAQIEVNNRLAESEGKADGGKDDSLKILQQRHRLELEQTKKHQQDLILQNNFSEDELLRVNFENNRELLLQERKQYEQQLELVKDNALEQQKIMADIAKIDAELSKSISDFRIDEAERRQKEEERLEKERIQQLENSASELLAQAEENTHKEYLVIINAANKEIQTSKGRANEIKRIDDQLTLDLIRNEIKNLDFAIEKMDEETEAYRQAMERRRRLREMEGEQENRQEEENQKIRSDLRKQIFEKSGELLMEGFNIANNIYDAQLQKLKEHYDLEVAMAGDSVERRIMAERKYEKEKAKIMRRQAIAEKAQAALGIALNTAQAIMSIWAQVPMADFGISAGILTAIVSALGAAQLAAVLATPIPQFAEGTKHAPDRFVAGEDGQELILKPTGEAVLTPDKPTLFSDKSFIGSTILPHDETQKWLANYAVSQSYDLIDMSFANKYLKKIADNTKGDNREMFTLNGKTYMKRGYVTSLIT
jgi:tape measure domain-containing protein